MAVGARFRPPGWLAGAVGVALLLSGCTGSTTTLPSTTPLTPGGSFVGTLTEATTDASGAPGPGSGTSTGPVSPTSLSAPLGLSTPARTGQSLSLSLSDRPPASTGATTPTSPTPTAPTPPRSTQAASTARSGPSVATGPATQPTVTVQTSGLAPKEAANRKAIVEVWVRYWGVYQNINNVAAPARAKLVSTVAVDPVKKELLASAVLFDQKHQNTYGSVSHRVYWGPPVNDDHTAIMGDCLDTSNFGSKDVKTGSKLTEGYTRDNTRGIFAKQPDGSWLVEQVQILDNQPC